jgi:hypothetical protein
MIKHLFLRRRREAPRTPSGLDVPRPIAHVQRGPAPMPRMRWY